MHDWDEDDFKGGFDSEEERLKFLGIISEKINAELIKKGL